MNFRYVIVDHLVDLNGSTNCAGITVGDGRLRIGAMTRQRDTRIVADIAQHCPLMAEALRHVGHRQTRNRGTIGGSLAHADPAAELPAVCAAHDAVIHVASVRGIRADSVPRLRHGLHGDRACARRNDRGHRPADSGGRATATVSTNSPAGRRLRACRRRRAARCRRRRQCRAPRRRLRCSASRPRRCASTRPKRALTGQPLDAALDPRRRRRGVADRADPDIHASGEYRRHLAQVLSARALDATRRARAGVDSCKSSRMGKQAIASHRQRQVATRGSSKRG